MFNVAKSGPCRTFRYAGAALFLILVSLTGCASFKSADTFRDQNMDFGSVHTVAVMPFNNLTRDNAASDRVRDVFTTALLATGGVYVLPAGEVYRGIVRTGITNPAAPSPEEVVKMGKFVKADAVMVGTLREYGEVRSGTAVGYIISLSMQLMETQTGRIVWSGSTTVGGVGITDRLFGGGGEPMNPITEKAVNDIINKLFS
jgi:hypothetical protein